MRVRLLLAALIGLALAAPAAARADSFTDALKRAETSYAAGKYDQALNAMFDALYRAWDKSPFLLTSMLMVQEPAKGYGLYEPRSSNVFKPNEKIFIYAEPAAYGFKKSGDRFEFGFSVDFSVATEDGRILGGQKEFGSFTFNSRVANTETMLSLTLTISGLEPGRYVLEITVHDKIGGGAVSRTLPFAVAGG